LLVLVLVLAETSAQKFEPIDKKRIPGYDNYMILQ
jgi:hypothetical protein